MAISIRSGIGRAALVAAVICAAAALPLFGENPITPEGDLPRIFYCMPDKAHREGVASADTVAGPFKTTFAYSWAKQIDSSIFRDDDGTLYYFWGQFSAKGAVTLGFHGRGGSFRGRNDANLFDVVSFQFYER